MRDTGEVSDNLTFMVTLQDSAEIGGIVSVFSLYSQRGTFI